MSLLYCGYFSVLFLLLLLSILIKSPFYSGNKPLSCPNEPNAFCKLLALVFPFLLQFCCLQNYHLLLWFNCEQKYLSIRGFVSQTHLSGDSDLERSFLNGLKREKQIENRMANESASMHSWRSSNHRNVCRMKAMRPVRSWRFHTHGSPMGFSWPQDLALPCAIVFP